jgi:hypothetical protein
MPYKIIHEGKGYFVQNAETKKKYSSKPLPKKVATKQRLAIILSEQRKNPNLSVRRMFV